MAFGFLNQFLLCVVLISAVLCLSLGVSIATSDQDPINSTDIQTQDVLDDIGNANAANFSHFLEVSNVSDNSSLDLIETQKKDLELVQIVNGTDNDIGDVVNDTDNDIGDVVNDTDNGIGDVVNDTDNDIGDVQSNISNNISGPSPIQDVLRLNPKQDILSLDVINGVPKSRSVQGLPTGDKFQHEPIRSTATPYSVEKPFGIEGKPLVTDINKIGHKAFHPIRREHQWQPLNLPRNSNILGYSARPTMTSSISSSQTFPQIRPGQIKTDRNVQQQTNFENVAGLKLNVSPSVSSLYKNIVTQILYHVLDTMTQQGYQPGHSAACKNNNRCLGGNGVSEVPTESDNRKSETHRPAFSGPLSYLAKSTWQTRNQVRFKGRRGNPVDFNDGIPGASSRMSSRSSDSSPVDGNIANSINDLGGSLAGSGIGDGSGLALGVDQTVFNRFATETLNFEKQSATEIARLDNLLRQLAVAAQSDFASVSSGVSNLQQEITRTQQQLVQAWNIMNNTHVKDIGQINYELQDLKADVFRLHTLITGATPVGQSDPKGRAAEVREEAKVGIGVDCAALLKSGVNVSGVYDLQPDPSNNQTQMTAFCDMETEGGGWTVFQRRQDGSDDFFRGWNSYKHGFGSFLHDHWLGLENIHLLTKYGDNVMRIEITDWENETRWAEFSFTRILDESDGYRILVGGYHGTAGDPFHSLSYDMRMQSMRFSTFDSDNDLDSGGNCALTFTSGWWFNKCFQINLNGVWYSSSRYAGPSMNGIVWDLWHEHFNGYSLKRTEMKLRPADFNKNTK